MNNNEKFLDVYKELEGVLRDQGIETKVLEESLEDEFQNKLRICRQIRNYMSHNSDSSFITISDSQIKFITKLLKDQKMKNDIARKHLGGVSAYCCSLDDKCYEVLGRMCKRKITEMPVYSEIKGVKTFGIVTIFDIAELAKLKTQKISNVKKLGSNYLFTSPETSMENIPENRVIFCTDTGTKDGKLLGVIKD